MRRVVVTGMGIVSSIGNSAQEVVASLHDAKSAWHSLDGRGLPLQGVAFDTAVAEGRLPAGFDDRFIRLWRYYLRYCEGGFRGGGIDVHQVTLVRR